MARERFGKHLAGRQRFVETTRVATENFAMQRVNSPSILNGHVVEVFEYDVGQIKDSIVSIRRQQRKDLMDMIIDSIPFIFAGAEPPSHIAKCARH